MRKHRFHAPWRLLSLFCLAVLTAAPTFAGGGDDPIQERMKKDITYLASEECEGRGVDTEGINRAADYIVSQIKQAGVKPGGKDGSYFQPFTINRGQPKIDKAANKLELKGPTGHTVELTFDSDFKVLPFSASGKVTAPIVFVGYGVSLPPGEDAKDKTGDGPAKKEDAKKQNFEFGLTPTALAPAQQKKGKQKDQPAPAKEQPPVTWVGYDDFKGIDVAGKIVVVLRRVPRWDNVDAPFAGNKDTYAGFEKKIANCELNKAAAVFFVNDSSEAADGDKFMAVQGKGQGVKATSIPVVQLRRSMLDTLLISGNGTPLANLEKDIDRDLKPRSAPITGWSATLTTAIKPATFAVKNIIGVLEGSGPLADETIVIGSHYDHLGFGGLVGGGKGMGGGGAAPKRFPGADDNGSGSTTMIELARRFGAIKNRQGRRLVIMWFTGEELGLLGSKHYAQEPLFPLDKTAAMVNMDMVGRLNDKGELVAEGFETGKGLQELLTKLNEEFNFKFVPPMQNGKYTPVYGRSDQQSFYNKKIPSVFFFSGFHPDYHKQTDFADRINVAGMVKITNMTEKLIAYLLAVEKRPEFVPLPPGKGKKGGDDLQAVPRAFVDSDRANFTARALQAGTDREPARGDSFHVPERVLDAIRRLPGTNVNAGPGIPRR